MKQLKVVTWNVEGMFADDVGTRRATEHDGIATIKDLDADIIVMPEFGKHNGMPEHLRVTLQYLGYEIAAVPYENNTEYYTDVEHQYPHEIVILSRLPIGEIKKLRLGGVRNAIEITCSDSEGQDLRIIGVHFDDTHEVTRLKQAKDLARILADSQEPALVMGDFNAMANHSAFAKLARTKLARYAAQKVSHKIIKAMAVRVNEMALGTTIQYILDHTNLVDLDPGHHRTISAKQSGVEWMPKLRLAKIDWIFGTKHFRVKSYKVLHDVGSDHRPVRAVLEYS